MRFLLLTIFLVGVTFTAKSQTNTSPDDLVKVTTEEFQHLDWVTGTWRGTGGGESEPFFENYEFIVDHTIRFRTYENSAMTKQNSVGEIKLVNDTITYKSGDFIWKATAIGEGMIKFSPWQNVSNSFVWTKTSEDAWKAVLIYPRKDQTDEKVTYILKRLPS